jgi:hypothetical protein
MSSGNVIEVQNGKQTNWTGIKESPNLGLPVNPPPEPEPGKKK